MTKIVFILLILVAFPAFLYFIQDSMIYFPRKYTWNYGVDSPKGFVKIEYRTSEGNQTSFYVPPRSEPSKLPDELWITFGGNASLALDWLPFTRSYPNDNAGFLLFDFPGYGLSEGRPTPESILAATNSSFAALAKHLGADVSELESRLHLLGHSLGAAGATQFAAEKRVGKLLLMSPFTSALDMAKRSVGIPLCYLLKHRFDNRARLQEIIDEKRAKSITIIHGANDGIIPVKMGRELGKTFAEHVKYIEVENGSHNGLPNSVTYQAMQGK